MENGNAAKVEVVRTSDLSPQIIKLALSFIEWPFKPTTLR